MFLKKATAEGLGWNPSNITAIIFASCNPQGLNQKKKNAWFPTGTLLRFLPCGNPFRRKKKKKTVVLSGILSVYSGVVSWFPMEQPQRTGTSLLEDKKKS